MMATSPSRVSNQVQLSAQGLAELAVQLENLVAIYEPEALPLLEAGISQGLFKLSRLIPADLRYPGKKG